jgi:phosphohistidine phosphatase
MKTLLLVRHAKSSRDDPRQSDHDRPLNERGQREAPLVGDYLRDRQLVPDCVLSSTALRAKETARRLIAASGFTGDLDLRRELYLAAPDNFVRVLRSLAASPRCVAVVAHNPGLEQYVAQLTGEHPALPTSAVAEIQLDLDDWADIVPGTAGELISLWRPKDED